MFTHDYSMAKKRQDRSTSESDVQSNPFAEALANALGVPVTESSERLAWDEDDVQEVTRDSKWVHIGFEKKGRGGKTVTLVNFQSVEADTANWAKKLKSRLGVGGAIDSEGIVLQGDVRTKVETYLQEAGFKTKRIGG
jgi:translation initiation factor 1